MRRIGLLVVFFAALMIGSAARADDFELPGLEADSNAYLATLTKRTPAGGTLVQRRAAEQQATAATQRRDWPAAATALEQRLGMGEPSSQLWLQLATAQMRRTPPDPQKALLAAWQSFSLADSGTPEVAPLLVIADALRLLDRNAQAVEALEQVVSRAPDDTGFKRLLADAQRATGLLVRRVRPEGDAEPPRACIEFSVAPLRRADFNAADWVRLDPPVPDAAVTREADQICVSGLPAGLTTSVILRAGLPGEGGLALIKEARLSVSMPNRRPTLIFDSRLFVLPRGQAPKVTLSSVNISSVSLKLTRMTERTVAMFLRDRKLGDTIEGGEARSIANDNGRLVWEGHADIPKWQSNRTARTALPIPEALLSAGPGLYALLAAPDDGTDVYESSAAQLILRTDLAPTIWRGTDGLTVQLRSYADAKVRSGVKLQLLARNNDILGEAITDDQGVARFAAPLLHGEDNLAPAVLHAFAPDGDFAALDLNAAAFDLSDRGVAGQPSPGPLDAFLWLDRGIYRPGETVQISALLRDGAGQPADIPAQLTIKRPNGQVFVQTTAKRGPDASLYAPVALSNGAAAGTWTIELRADPKAAPIGRAEFRVDAFVPDRMAVEFAPLAGPLVPGQSTKLAVTARFLYGAPAAGLSGRGSLHLVIDPSPFPALAGYRIGLADEAFAPDTQELELPDTDAKGSTALTVAIPRAPDTTAALKAEVTAEVNDPSGHAARATVTVPVRPAGPLIGIKPGFDDNAVDAKSEAAFDIAAVQPDGRRTAMNARLRLVRERPDWRIVVRGSLARYETTYRDEPLETRDVAIPADAPLHFSKRLDFGRYRIEVSQANGMAVTSYRFRSGWTGSDSPDVPDRVDVSVDRRAIPVGETAHVHVAAPFAGEATLLVLSDRVHLLRTVTVPEGGTDLDVPVEASWGPGAYVTVHVFRGADGSNRPARAIGLAWVGVDPSARTLPLQIAAAEKYLPRGRAVIPVKTAPGAWVSLAAVDEGILRLTRFVSPDPAAHFLGRRTLGLDIRDDWGRLIAPAEGEATLLRQGGDDSGFSLPDVPQHTVVLFAPAMQADADGAVQIPLDFPDFAGQVRLMAVAWQGARVGAASTDVLVRDPLVAEALLPRFLAPGDETRLAVLMQNLDLPAGDAAVQITLEGPLALSGPDRIGASLAASTQAVPSTVLRATGAGRGVIHLDVTGPGGFRVRRDVAITVRPPRGPTTVVSGQEMAAGASLPLAVASDRFIPGTWRASASFGAPVRYDTAALVQALASYPLSCLEQTTSRGFPLALLPDGPIAGEDRMARLQAAVASVLDRQRYDGGFALWTANGEGQPWLTPYATEFLVRAQAAGATVPDQALADVVKYMTEMSDSPTDDAAALAAQAYRLYALALAGHGRPGAARVLAQNIDSLPTPLAKAQLAAALALAHDTPRAEAAFTAALADPARKWWYGDYGTALRDQAAIAVLLKESGLLPDRLAKLVQVLPGSNLAARDLSTQEQAWVAAAAAVLGRDGRATRIEVNGQPLVPDAAGGIVSVALTGPVTVRNVGKRAVWESLSATGVPIEALPASRAGMRGTRQFFTLDGKTLNLDDLRQNTVFVLLIEGRADDGQDHPTMVFQGLPAGWEIAGRLPAGAVPGMSWLGELTETDAQPAADDRFAAVVALTHDKPDFRIAVRLRAVTPGNYEIPGAELADMYRPAIYARQGSNRIRVLAAE